MEEIKTNELRNMACFFKIIPEDIEVFLKFTEDKKFKVGEVLFKEHDKTDGKMYIILDGEVELSKETRKGAEIIAAAQAGEVVGEIAVLEDSERTATAKVFQESRMIVLNLENYRKLKDSNPQIALMFLENILRISFNRLKETGKISERMKFWL